MFNSVTWDHDRLLAWVDYRVNPSLICFAIFDQGLFLHLVDGAMRYETNPEHPSSLMGNMKGSHW